jgi:PKD repeat protein
VVRRQDAAPVHVRDGVLVYEGRLGACTDIDVQQGQTYHYTLFTTDRAGNWSTGISACGSPMTAPSADFGASPLLGPAPLPVTFTDLSSGGPTSFEWDFDSDGTIDSNLQHPNFTYMQPGLYTVTLTVRKAGACGAVLSDTEVKANYVVVQTTATYLASAGYGPTDHDLDPQVPWDYRYFEASTYLQMSWDSGPDLRWEKPGTNCLVRPTQQHPIMTADSCRVFIVPYDGTVRVTGTVKKLVANGDGISATILQGSTVKWGPALVTTTAGVAHDITFQAAAGDTVVFRVNKNVNTNYDTTVWDPTVSVTYVP